MEFERYIQSAFCIQSGDTVVHVVELLDLAYRQAGEAYRHSGRDA